MPTWPGTLPTKPQRNSFRYGAVSNVISFGTDVGPGKVRRRSTARIKKATGAFWMTEAQLATFQSFFEVDLKDGALAFDWPDPITAVTASWRFDPGSAYEVSPVGPDTWQVNFTLIRLP